MVCVVIVNVVEKITQPSAHVDFRQFAAAHEGVDDGGILGGIVISAEEIPLAPDGQWPYAVLDEVIPLFG